MSSQPIQAKRTQKGIILFVSLILLLVLSLLGITLARTQTVEERLAQNEDNHQIALEAAEAAMHVAVDDMLAGAYNATQLQPALFTLNSTTAASTGLYDTRNEPTAPQSIASVVNWSSATAVLAYNGPALTSLPAAAQNPVFLIEALDGATAPGALCNSGAATVYRITAHGWGGDGQATATLQQIFYRC